MIIDRIANQNKQTMPGLAQGHGCALSPTFKLQCRFSDLNRLRHALACLLAGPPGWPGAEWHLREEIIMGRFFDSTRKYNVYGGVNGQ